MGPPGGLRGGAPVVGGVREGGAPPDTSPRAAETIAARARRSRARAAIPSAGAIAPAGAIAAIAAAATGPDFSDGNLGPDSTDDNLGLMVC